MNRTELSQALAEATGSASDFAARYRTAQRYLEFGKAVRKLREDYSLTQQELASRTGIDQSDISRLENGVWGKRGISVAVMDRILAEFDYRLEFMILPAKVGKEEAIKQARSEPEQPMRRGEITTQVIIQEDEYRYR